MSQEELKTAIDKYLDEYYDWIFQEVRKARDEEIKDIKKYLQEDLNFKDGIVFPIFVWPLSIASIYGLTALLTIKEVFIVAFCIAISIAAVLMFVLRRIKRHHESLTRSALSQEERAIIRHCLAISECQMIERAESVEEEIAIRDFFLCARYRRLDILVEEIEYRIYKQDRADGFEGI